MTDSEETPETTADEKLSASERETQIAKLKKKLPASLVEELVDLSKDDLKARIARCAVNIRDTKIAQSLDEELAQKKAEAREMAAPYRDAVKMQTQISSLCALLLDA